MAYVLPSLLRSQTSFILRKYGPRIVGLVGVSFLSLSLFLCSFATNSLGGLIVLQGCCAGIANGALFMVSPIGNASNRIADLP